MRNLRSLSIYGFAIFFNAAVSFVIFSLLTHRLNEVDYGIINLYNSFLIFLSPFIGVGVQFVIGVDFFKMDQPQFRKHFTNALAIPVVSCILFIAIVLLFHSYVENFIHVSFLFALILPVLCLMTIFYDVILTLIRDKGMPVLFSGFSISKNLIEAGLTVLLVIGLGFNWKGRLESSILSLVIMMMVVIYLVKKWNLYTGKVERTDVKKTFFTGLPFLPERLAIFILGYSDRFFINYYQGTGDVGFYSAGAQIAIIINLSALTVNNVLYPSVYRILSQERIYYDKIKKIVLGYLGVSAFMAIAILIAIPFLFKFFVGPKFQQGQQYAMLLTIGLFFWAIYNAFLVFLLNAKKNKLIMTISIGAMTISVLLNFILVKRFGALGATYTSIIVYFIMAATTIFFVNKFCNLNNIFFAGKKYKAAEKKYCVEENLVEKI